MSKLIEVMDMIIADCEQDVEDFDGKEFNGKTLGELHGILEAKIQALAKAIKKLAEDSQRSNEVRPNEESTRKLGPS